MFFAVSGHHTLGREESRGGRFLDRRDYCKLHIITHYVRTLLGEGFTVIPVGKVGDDEVGDRLLVEIREAGLDLRYVEQVRGQPTLYALCFIYPDGDGGNLTTNDSACAHVGAEFVDRAAPEFARFEGRGVALSVPEVPDSKPRLTLLDAGARHSFLRVASFTSAEMPEVVEKRIGRQVDLLTANLDEAAAAVGLAPESAEPAMVVQAAVDLLAADGARLTITAGARGSWSWDGTRWCICRHSRRPCSALLARATLTWQG